MNRFFIAIISLLIRLPLFAEEVIPELTANGIRYEGVKLGPVNDNRVVLFHSRGVTSVPVGTLPDEYRSQMNPTIPIENSSKHSSSRTPADIQPPSSTPSTYLVAKSQARPSDDWGAYNYDRTRKVLLDGKLVDIGKLTMLVGFLVKERTSLGDGSKTYTGAAFDLAAPKEQSGKISTSMALRPSLWNRTGERVFLLNYRPMSIPGALLKVSVIEVDPLEGWRTFRVGTEPSFEEWKKAGGR